MRTAEVEEAISRRNLNRYLVLHPLLFADYARCWREPNRATFTPSASTRLVAVKNKAKNYMCPALKQTNAETATDLPCSVETCNNAVRVLMPLLSIP